MRKRDKASRVLVLPNQTPGLCDLCGLTRTQVDWELWAVEPGGGRWAGAAAVNRTLQELGGVWAWMAALYRIPLIRWIENRVYRWVAEHRPFFSKVWGAPPEWDE